MRISVVTPVFDETESVSRLCEELASTLGKDLFEILIVISPKSSPACFEACARAAQKNPGLIQIMTQKGPRGIGIAYREGIAAARGTHILCIDSDGEMETASAGKMRDLMATGNYDLVTASRWAPGGGFEGYSPLKKILNWGYQKLFRILFWTRLTDLTYGYKMFRTDLARQLPFRGIRHEFACEGTLLPVRLDWRVTEVPSRWTRRKSGATKNRFLDNFRYVWMALRLRLGS